MPIKIKDMPLIIALLEEPLATHQELRDLVAQFSETSWDVSNISRKMAKFFDPKEGFLYGVQGTFNLDLLNLELHSFLIDIEDSDWEKNASIIDNFATLHPYTVYINNIYGTMNGIYLQFHVPKKSDVARYIKRALNEFKEEGVIKSYVHLESVRTAKNSNGSISSWDPYTGAWHVNFHRFKEILFSDDIEELWIVNKKNILHKLDDFDFAIIRELSKDLRRTQIQIINSIFEEPAFENGYDPYILFRSKFPRSKQTLSRRLRYFNEIGLIQHKWLVFDRERFGLLNQILFIFDRDDRGVAALAKTLEETVETIGMTTRGKYKKMMKVNPYPSSISVASDHVVFWMYLPASDITRFTDILVRRFKNVQVYLLAPNPKAYFFNNFNFDSAHHAWKVDPTYVYGDVMYQLKMNNGL